MCSVISASFASSHRSLEYLQACTFAKFLGHRHARGPMTAPTPLKAQLQFLLELDRLKSVVRQSRLADGSRRENAAEHSWHLALFALLLSEHADVPVDAAHAAKLLLIHDIVEIDAGDAPIHASGASKAAIEAAEHKAANRIFGLLPADQATA